MKNADFTASEIEAMLNPPKSDLEKAMLDLIPALENFKKVVQQTVELKEKAEKYKRQRNEARESLERLRVAFEESI